MVLTVVTATYNCISSGNRENLIRSIESVSRLNVSHEHLIYDGASKDGTVELLLELERTTPGLKVTSEPDTGIYNALNKGVRDAKGEWFYVLGADDYICDANRLANLIENESLETQVIIAPVSHDGEMYQYHGMCDLKWIFWRHPYCHQGVIARTCIIRRYGGFDETFRLCADGDLCLKFHEDALCFHYTEDEFTNYAHGGVSDTNGKEVWGEVTCFLQKHLGMTNAEAVRFRQVGAPPLRTMITKLWHRDIAFRIGARFMIRRWISYRVRQPFRRMPSSWKCLIKRLVQK